MIRVDGRGDSSSLIKVRGLNKTYSRGGEKIQVLQGLNLDVDKGDFVAFMGPSGSGKTTLLNLLGGLDVPSAGSITVDGDEITHMSASKLTQWRARHVGFIRSEEHTSELQSRLHLVCRLLLEKKKKKYPRIRAYKKTT